MIYNNYKTNVIHASPGTCLRTLTFVSSLPLVQPRLLEEPELTTKDTKGSLPGYAPALLARPSR
jgi:hypothetical protein